MKRAYINGIILDGSENMQPQKGMSIITDGEKIVGIVLAGSEGADCEKVDLGGKYIVPGPPAARRKSRPIIPSL